jgi:hypothetical protein
MLATPVLLLIFNRPALTQRVFDAVAVAQPQKVLVVADGPRADRPGEDEACQAARAIVERIDWDCEVIKNYAPVNLGCKDRVASGISWAFEQVDEAIILEDDCVPHPSFFRFSEELLERYRDDDRVMHIAGTIYRRKPIPTPYSYVFSQFNSAWGWATWRRAWRHFDVSVRAWPERQLTSWLSDRLEEPRATQYWDREFQAAHEGRLSTWDHQWTFACWARDGLSIAPRTNLVSNIGCGGDATHTLDEADPIANVPATAMSYPLIHPPAIERDLHWDRAFLRTVILPRLYPPAPSALRRFAARLTPEGVKKRVRQFAADAGFGRFS